MPEPEQIQFSGPFIKLGPRTWVRADAIVVIRGREQTGSEVVVRATGEQKPLAVWTDYGYEQIITAICDAETWREQ